MNTFNWTPELDDTLRQNWTTVDSLKQMARLIGCESQTVLRRVKRLGLPERKWRSLRYDTILRPMAHITFPRVRECQWPEGDVGDPDFHFCGEPTVRGSYCHAHYERSVRRTQVPPPKRHKRAWTDEEVELLKRLYAEGALKNDEIADRVGRSRGVLQKKIRQLGLSKSSPVRISRDALA